MNGAESLFEEGRMSNYKRDFHKTGNYRGNDYERNWSSHRKKFEYTNSTETTETSEGFVFRIPLSEISIENLKIIPTMKYILVQSNKKTIFIKLDTPIKLENLSTTIKENMLIISVKK
ncbi:hypothetical protein JXB41_04030 [Candidatus Woesearchaeota archaeon]|nr:hypothetical protein [Candidatus Woesearchaeota archaeon]